MKLLKLFEDIKNDNMKNKDSWEELNNKLIRTFYFKDYSEVMDFVKKVMDISQKQNHHPDMTVHYDNVKLSVTDHEKGKVSDKCHKLAKSIDKI
jgi:4a-hydroxytetrahydrobiopterin dehydratase